MAIKLTKSDEQSGARALAWTHGVGRPTESAATELDALFALFAASQADEVATPHAATKSAEQLAGWERSRYWFIGTVNRAFGALAVGEFHPDLGSDSKVAEASICPFDTGGLLLDPPKYNCGVEDPGERLQYVKDHSSELDGWHERVRNALNSSFRDFSDYVDGRPPDSPLTANEHSHWDSGVDDGRPWSWEGRVSSPELIRSLEPRRLHWHSETDRRIALSEIRNRVDAGSIGVDAAADLLASIVGRSEVSPRSDAHEDVRDLLKARAASS